MVSGTCYRHEEDMVPAPGGIYCLVGERKLVSKRMIPIFTIVESPEKLGKVLPKTSIER